MPAKNRVQIGAWMTPEEKLKVTDFAQKLHLSTSEFVRRIVMGRKLPDIGRYKAIIDLIKINADLARLGNLFKLALDAPKFIPPEGVDLEKLLTNVRETQAVLKTKIAELSR